MKTTMGVDPGKDTGWAVFVDGILYAAGLSFGPFDEIAEDVALEMRRVLRLRATRGIGPIESVIEVPQVYPQRRWKGDPNDLIGVALIAGAVGHALADSGNVEFVKPHEWKGNAPKKVGVGQTLGCLTDDERRILDDSGVINSKKHNMIDAVGLGLWKLGRR